MNRALITLVPLALAHCATHARSSAQEPSFSMPSGPAPIAPDLFHPQRSSWLREELPRRGGSVTVHVAAFPRTLNAMLESSATARAVLQELHEPLLHRDWETWEWKGVLADRWWQEDGIVDEQGALLAWGKIEERDDTWSVFTESPGAAVDGPFEVAREPGRRLERGTVWTFALRDGVRWHDGHPFSARDVLFSYQCFRNPAVHCDRKRYLFEKIAHAEALDDHTVRFVLARPYSMATSIFDESFTILPAHLYDLGAAENPAHRSDASAEEQGQFVNDNPHNREWVGLGPYRLSSWTSDVLEAHRVDGYALPGGGGYLDTIRWRAIPDTTAAFQAVLAGELDVYDRLSAEQYFGAEGRSEAFERGHYRAFVATPYVGSTVWNTQKPALADARVRRALGMAFDWDDFARTWYRGLAARASSEQYWPSPVCDRALPPLPFDPAAAQRELADAGWYDRDGDGQVDKDGAPLAIALAYPSGNETSEAYGLRFQEQLAAIGVRLELRPLDQGALTSALGERQFDAAALGWALTYESDPEPVWHSRWSHGNTANRSGLADAEVDALIEAIQGELDAGRRVELFHRLQRRIVELQPVQFGLYVPRRLAIARKLRNVQLFALDPGWSIRRWWSVEGDR